MIRDEWGMGSRGDRLTRSDPRPLTPGEEVGVQRSARNGDAEKNRGRDGGKLFYLRLLHFFTTVGTSSVDTKDSESSIPSSVVICAAMRKYEEPERCKFVLAISLPKAKVRFTG